MVSASVVRDTGILEESYTYDYLGNRTSKTSDGKTTYFTTDLSSGYSQVLKAETSTETIYYVRGFELISRRTGNEASYYLFDGGMSVRGITDEEGNLTDTLVFDAFGNEAERTGSTENVYGFQGEEQDETGLYYLRARYMDPATGTFTSMDTYGGSLENPMSLHKYLFANSNPVKWCDPSGHMSLGESVAVGAIIGALAGADYYMVNLCLNYDDGFRFNGSDCAVSIILGTLIGIAVSFLIYKLVILIIAYLAENPDSILVAKDRFALGIKEELEKFASEHNAQTYNSRPSDCSWQYYVEQKIKDPKVDIYFNLNGINLENLEVELRLAEYYEMYGKTLPGFHWTSWELFIIYSNELEETVRWFLNGMEVANPFG